MTSYIVLTNTEKGWQQLTGTYSGSRPRAAIEAALATGSALGEQAGEYVAVPARSWKPVKVKVEKALKFS